MKQPSFGLFPIPFPDETCYSLLCRYAVRRGLYSTNQITLELFGHTEPLAGYLFKPFRVKDIDRWLKSRIIGYVLQFGEHHSCYPFYKMFLKPPDAVNVKLCHRGSVLTPGQAKRINRECGFTKNHKKNLWYCPACVQEDITGVGETCWRRLPQMPGAVYCPIHRVRFAESSVSYREINYRIIPATYGLMHVPDPRQENGNIYANRYIELAEDIAWLLEHGLSAWDREWMKKRFLMAAGRHINDYLLYNISRSPCRANRFEDYLSNRIAKDIGSEMIGIPVSSQIGSILSIQKAFGTIEKFCSP